MKMLLLIIAFLGLKKSNAQTRHEVEVMKTVILDNFSQWKDTLFDKAGKIKKVETPTKRNSIIIKKTTVPNTLQLKASTYHNLKENIFNSLDSITYKDFLDKRNRVSEIKYLNISETLIKTKYIDTVALDSIFKKGGWKKFNKLYSLSTDLVEISRVGFNKDKTQALIYYSRSNCGLCGSGYLCLYELINGRWRLVEKYMEWIA